jgi:hypothetical protein
MKLTAAALVLGLCFAPPVLSDVSGKGKDRPERPAKGDSPSKADRPSKEGKGELGPDPCKINPDIPACRGKGDYGVDPCAINPLLPSCEPKKEGRP